MLALLLVPTPSVVEVPVAILQRMSDGRFTTAAACETPNSWLASSDGTALSEFWQTYRGSCWLDSSWQAVAVAGLAAVHDFNERAGTFAPSLGSDAVLACDKQLSVSLLDSGSTGPAALVEFVKALYSTAPPIALVGPARSASSKSVAGLAGVKNLPQISYWATSAELDDTSSYPRFMRTIPSDVVAASALCSFWDEQMSFKHVAIVYMGDTWGDALAEGLSSYCGERSIYVESFRFESGSDKTTGSIQAAVRGLRASGIRVVLVACMGSTECGKIVEEALEVGALDPTKPSWWGFADGVSLSDARSFSPQVQEALHGSFQVLPVGGVEGNARWDAFVESWADRSAADYNRFLPPDWQLPDDFFSATAGAKSHYGLLSQIGAYEYDAVVALGLLACEAAPTGALPASFGARFWAVKDTLQFAGLSGNVRFTADGIGNRDPSTANVQLRSWQLEDATGGGGGGSLGDKVLARYEEGAWVWEGGSQEASGMVFNGGGTSVPDDCDGNECQDYQAPGEWWNKWDYLPLILVVLGGVIALVLLVALLWRAVRRCKEARQLLLLHEAQVQARIMDATKKLSTLSFSMCFVPFSKLRQHGKLVPHEEARIAGELVVIDTFDQLHSFLKASPTVFISHQWLDFGAPDPNNVHFDAICAALSQLCDEFDKNPDELHVWLDYSSIPQVNRVLQKLSIDTLSVYASVCTFFVIVAPETVHLGTGLPCNKETYSRRGWCRLEQWARIAVGGVHNIYLYQQAGEPLRAVKGDAEWLQKSIFVCGGDFAKPDEDRPKLVDNLLALWGCMLETKDGSPEVTAIYDHVVARRHEVFPKALFGDLVDRLDDLFLSGKHEQRRERKVSREGGGTSEVAHCRWRTIHRVVSVARPRTGLHHPTLSTAPSAVMAPPAALRVASKLQQTLQSNNNAKGADDVVSKLQQTLQSSDNACKRQGKDKRMFSYLRSKAGQARQDTPGGGALQGSLHSLQASLQELGSHLHLKELGSHLEHLTEHVGTSFFEALKLHEHPSLATSREASVTSHIQLGLHVASSLQQLSGREQLALAARALQVQVQVEARLSEASTKGSPPPLRLSDASVSRQSHAAPPTSWRINQSVGRI
jgi:hypothetical protein